MKYKVISKLLPGYEVGDTFDAASVAPSVLKVYLKVGILEPVKQAKTRTTKEV